MKKARKEEKKLKSFHNSWKTRKKFKQERLKAEKLMEKVWPIRLQKLNPCEQVMKKARGKEKDPEIFIIYGRQETSRDKNFQKFRSLCSGPELWDVVIIPFMDKWEPARIQKLREKSRLMRFQKLNLLVNTWRRKLEVRKDAGKFL